MKLNFSFVADYLPKFISGLKLTIVLSVWAVIGATLIGILVYWMRTFPFFHLKGASPLGGLYNLHRSDARHPGAAANPHRLLWL